MKVKILILATENIENITISTVLWRKLHTQNKHYFNKEYADFLNKFELNPTFFNLSCLDELRGVILTDAQVLNLRTNNGEGGIINNENK